MVIKVVHIDGVNRETHTFHPTIQNRVFHGAVAAAAEEISRSADEDPAIRVVFRGGATAQKFREPVAIRVCPFKFR